MSANPQLEDGYIKIANELYDAVLLHPFTARQLKVVLAIMRKTYGFNKKVDDISSSQIGEMCGMARTHATNTLNELVRKNVISKVKGKYGSLVEINKNFRVWTSTESVHPLYQIGTCTESVLAEDNSLIPIEGCTESVHVDRETASTESVHLASTDSVHTKDNFPKDIKPIPAKPKSSDRKTAMPADFEISDRVRRWASEKGFDRLEQHFENFVGSAKARGYKYVDWDAAFENAVRQNWAKLPVSNLPSDGSAPWWKRAGFAKEWEALSAGATESNARFWKDRRPTRKLSGVSIEPWTEHA